jgi:cyclohexanone monooxygenase
MADVSYSSAPAVASAARHNFVTIVGAGPGGIAMAIRLKEAGIDDFVVLERAEGPGGTWVNNRYPGLACDVPASLYSYSFRQRADWPSKFSTRDEIRRYFEDSATDHGILPHIRFDTELTSAVWDEAESMWTLATADGQVSHSKVLISAVGMFNAVNRPAIDGLGEFAGEVVHTAEWPAEGMDLAGRSVAVVGTAASAVQVVPEVARHAGQLYVFQRTAAWIFPKQDEWYSEAELEMRRNDPEITDKERREAAEFFEGVTTMQSHELREMLRQAGMANLEAVADPETREKLTPRLPLGAQRPLLSDTYYPTFNLPQVELVTDEITQVTKDRIRCADGQTRNVDVIILATGYDTSRFFSVVDVTGRSATRLADVWSDGAYAYKGITVPQFPNMFMMYGPNSNIGPAVGMLELQAAYIAAKVGRMAEEGLAWIDVRADECDSFNAQLQEKIAGVDIWRTVGTRYFRAASGRIVTQWPGTMADYRDVLSDVDTHAYDEAALEGSSR